MEIEKRKKVIALLDMASTGKPVDDVIVELNLLGVRENYNAAFIAADLLKRYEPSQALKKFVTWKPQEASKKK